MKSLVKLWFAAGIRLGLLGVILFQAYQVAGKWHNALHADEHRALARKAAQWGRTK